MPDTPPQHRLYEVQGTATWFARLDDSVVQDVLMAITLALKTYGGQEVRLELREVHFQE